MSSPSFPALLQRFFADRLCVQMEASRHTVTSYRDTFRLLIRYVGARIGKAPTKLDVADMMPTWWPISSATLRLPEVTASDPEMPGSRRSDPSSDMSP